MDCEVHHMRNRPAISILGTTALLLSIAGTSVLAAQSMPGAAVLAPYSSCQFQDGLRVVRVDPLRPGVTSRSVETDSGPRQIDMQAGLRMLFAYPSTDYYANVKAELLPAANYPQLKRFLLDEFQYLSHRDKVNVALRSPINGFEVHGLDGKNLKGGPLGFYLLFDDSANVVTTIYLLNQRPKRREFQSVEEYSDLRDRFLNSYTACIRTNQKQPH
jgi:hypothetical protein